MGLQTKTPFNHGSIRFEGRQRKNSLKIRANQRSVRFESLWSRAPSKQWLIRPQSNQIPLRGNIRQQSPPMQNLNVSITLEKQSSPSLYSPWSYPQANAINTKQELIRRSRRTTYTDGDIPYFPNIEATILNTDLSLEVQ
ncbi:hypothetical protein U1Q18_006116, partial [Sarracenia purpurea var. burkii]